MSLIILAGLIVPLIGADDASAQIPGQQLNAEVIASDPANSLQPQVAADSRNHLHAVWYDTTAGQNSFKYSKGMWSGARYTWSGPVTILGGDPESTFIHPQITVDRLDRVHVVWGWDRTIYYRQWPAEGGLSQATPVVPIGGNGEYPSIAVDSQNRAHVVWESNNPDYDILYRRSDGGTSFTTAVDISPNDSDDSLEPDIAVDHNDVVHVVWYDKSPGAPRIQYTRTMGDTWSTPINISEPWGYFPEISADRQGCIHIAWATSANDGRALYRRNCNGNWEPGRDLGPASPLHSSVSATASGKVLVTWTNSQRLNYTFFNGTNWTPAQVLSSGATGPQLRPDSTRLPNGNLAVVWQERRPSSTGDQYDPMFGLFDLCNAGIASEVGIEQIHAASGHHRVYLPLAFNEKPRC